MTSSQHFSASYAEARSAFIEAAQARGASIGHHLHPERGRDGEVLATDVARLGDPGAGKVFFTMSATHGVEGFCGSGVQVAALAGGRYRTPGDGLAVVLIHAINPHGFSWLRRVTHENVDLNRNHVDHALPYPANDGYEALKSALCPPEWTAESRKTSRAALDAYGEQHGRMALQGAISGGQHSHPEGLFFGGHGPTWSARTLEAIVRRHARNARHVAFLDYHTGLGPYGVGELISDHALHEAGHRRLVDWFGGGGVTSTDDGSSVSATLTGTNNVAIARAGGGASLTMATLEYGTSPLEDVLESLMGDCWLHNHGDPDSAPGRAVKAEIRRCFYPDADDWKDMVLERAMAVEEVMLTGLAAMD